MDAAMRWLVGFARLTAWSLPMNDTVHSPVKAFQLEEATIADLHAAICAGRTTVTDVVKGYLARVRAYNGVASVLVTPDGASIPEAKGVVRAGAALRFPTG